MSYFVLVDCNNFYASCERLFNPKLETRPVIVLSNNDGCVIARSQEAKQLGIKMGEPFFKIRDFCYRNRVTTCSSNYQLYGDLSDRVMDILSSMAPEVEVYSIDEAFLRYTLDMENRFSNCVAIRKTIKKWTGLPVSLGIGPTKTLAKMANSLAKKERNGGVFDLMSRDIQREVLKNYPIKDIWGIGRRWGEKLNGMGIQTAGEFSNLDPITIRRKMGVVGERILWELRGISCLALEEAPEQKKSITCSRSFGKTVTDPAELAEALSTFVNKACIKLRQQKSCAKGLCVFLEAKVDKKEATRSHYSITTSFSLPTSDTPQVIAAAKMCLAKIFYKKERYKKCGVMLLDLVSENQVIPDLFLGSIDPKRKRLMETVDALNQQYGKDAIFYGAMGVDQKWKAQCKWRSQHYTTNWDDLAIAKAI